MRFRLISVVSSFIVLAALRCFASPAPDAPPQWLAYEVRTPGFVSPQVSVLYSAPEVALFQDGRIIWLDVANWRVGEGQNPCAWRTAIVTYRERSDFRTMLRDSDFFTVNLPGGTVGQDIPDAGRTYVGGYASKNKSRDLVVMSRYVPESQGSRYYVARANEIVDSLRVMTQRVSDCYRPDAIRVAAFEGLVTDATATVDWPVALKPGLKEGKLVEYRGDEAHKIIDALAVSTHVTIDGKGYVAAWAPIIDVPVHLPELTPKHDDEPPPPAPGR